MTREEAIFYIKELQKTYASIDKKVAEAVDMAIEALSAEQKEEELAKDIARRMATIIENEQDMRVILKNASAKPTDLISRKELLDRVKAINSIPWGDDHGNAVKLVWSTEEVKRLIEKAPSADRPSGEWICKDSADMSVYWFECSECGEKTPRDNFNHEYKSNYCPNCGADMRGEKRVND